MVDSETFTPAVNYSLDAYFGISTTCHELGSELEMHGVYSTQAPAAQCWRVGGVCRGDTSVTGGERAVEEAI